jgi:hypothetical protein
VFNSTFSPVSLLRHIMFWPARVRKQTPLKLGGGAETGKGKVKSSLYFF